MSKDNLENHQELSLRPCIPRLRTVFHLRAFHTHVHARESLNPYICYY